MAEATLKDIRDYFEMQPKELMDAWKVMSDKDKADLKQGIGDGSLTY